MNASSCSCVSSIRIRRAAKRRSLIAASYLDQVAEQQYSLLRRQLRVSEDELEHALVLVRACQPRPGSSVHSVPAEYIVPDVFVRRTERGWAVEINPASLPRIRVNQSYAGLIGRSSDHAMLRTQLQEARWLIRSLEIRNDTLLKVARCIVQRQSAFLENGDEYMQPMILKDVAEAVEMHESTISRVTTNKYMHTHRGVFEFRYFFSSHVAASDGTEMSSTAIRAKIRKLVAAGRRRQAAVRQPHCRNSVAGRRAGGAAHGREVSRSARHSPVQRPQASSCEIEDSLRSKRPCRYHAIRSARSTSRWQRRLV